VDSNAAAERAAANKAAAERAAAKKAAAAERAAANKATAVQQAQVQQSERASSVTPVERSAKTVTVKPGDTLAKIARSYGVEGGWKALHAANADTVANANLIFVGQTLHLPA
jgi:nucleoid-associated protein YgaU